MIITNKPKPISFVKALLRLVNDDLFAKKLIEDLFRDTLAAEERLSLYLCTPAVFVTGPIGKKAYLLVDGPPIEMLREARGPDTPFLDADVVRTELVRELKMKGYILGNLEADLLRLPQGKRRSSRSLGIQRSDTSRSELIANAIGNWTHPNSPAAA